MSKERREFIKEFYAIHSMQEVRESIGMGGKIIGGIDSMFDNLQHSAEIVWENFEKRNPANKQTKPTMTAESFSKDYQMIIDYLNKKAGTTFGEKGAQYHELGARLTDGWTGADICMMIQYMVRKWKGTDMEQYLRPSTLFRKSKFENYMQESIKFINHDKDQVSRIEQMLGV